MANRKPNTDQVSLNPRQLWLIVCLVAGGIGYYLGMNSSDAHEQSLRSEIEMLNDKIHSQEMLIQEQQQRLEGYEKIKDVVGKGIEKILTKKKNRE